GGRLGSDPAGGPATIPRTGPPGSVWRRREGERERGLPYRERISERRPGRHSASARTVVRPARVPEEFRRERRIGIREPLRRSGAGNLRGLRPEFRAIFEDGHSEAR